MADATDAGRRVIEAARELFSERGYSATTTRAIAERAGVNEVTIFRRFTNKAGILRVISDQFAEQAAGFAVPAVLAAQERQTRTGGTITAAEARATLTELARLEISSAVTNGGLALRLALEARSVPEVAEVLGPEVAGNAEGLVGFLAGCQQAGALRSDLPAALLAEAFFALTSNLVMARALMGASPPPDDAAVADLATGLTDLFWSGAGAPDVDPDPTANPTLS